MPEQCPRMAPHLTEDGTGRCFTLCGGVRLTQEDIREVQLAKGAIAAGIELMARSLDVALEEIDRVLLAGAFGSFIRKESACAIGLLPPELPRLDPHIDALHQPAGESPENEYQKQLIKTIFKRHFCSAPLLHRMLFIPFILSYSAGTCHFIFYKRNICIICQSVL